MIRPLSAALFLLLACACVSGKSEDAASLDGKWHATEAELGGIEFTDAGLDTVRLVVEGTTCRIIMGEAVDGGTLKLETVVEPNWLDITSTSGPSKGRTIFGIYEQRGDTLRVCYELSGRGRPTAFRTDKGTQLLLVTYERADD
jgi:uncharacterized protein (TIGR03067 family)